MSDIQIPQRNPPAPQFQPPSALIQQYLSMKPPAVYATEGLANAGSQIANYQNFKLQKQIAASEALGKLFEAGGPYAVQQYGQPLLGLTGQQTQTPQQAPMQQQTTGDTSSATQMAPPTDQSTAQAGQIPSTIQASLNMGHPDFMGLANKASQYAGMGKYGQNMTQNLKTQADLGMMPMTATQKQMEMQKTQNDMAMQPTEFETKKQQLINAQQQIPMEIKKTISGEVSKESQDTQNITQLKTLAANLQGALAGHDSGILGNVSGNLYQASGGRVGSSTAAAIQNAANPLATALNTELARRFNSGEVALLSQSLIPQPKDTPAFAQQKIANLNRLLDSMASGNEANVRNVAAAISTGAIPKIASNTDTFKSPTTSSVSATGPHGATVRQNGHTYTWNAKKGQYE